MAEKKLYRRIEIIPVVGGWIVQVGCKKIVYPNRPSGRAEMVHDLALYLDDPNLSEGDMLEKNLALNDEALACAPRGPLAPYPPEGTPGYYHPNTPDYPPGVRLEPHVGPHTEINPPAHGDIRNAVRTGEELHARDRGPR